jgi:lysophospholipase L1-like esterase
MRLTHTLLFATFALSTGFAMAQATATKPATAKPEKGSRAERKVVDLRITPDPKLPNVLLLGDSISIGYHLPVRELLAGKANVFRPVNPKTGGADNCSDTSKGVASLDAWLAMQPKWDVIHFNWGLHDIKHVKPGTSEVSSDPTHPSLRTLAEYQANLETIIGKLKATGAKLIFCTTTPVAPETTSPFRSNQDVESYNAAALKIMTSHGIEVDDLYAFAKPQLEKIQLPKNVHYTPDGSKTLASQVVKTIEPKLAK